MSSVNIEKYAPNFKISINGQVNSIVRQAAVSIQVNEEIGKTADFTIVLADNFDIKKQQFVWLDSPLFSPGQKISVEMGYTNNLKEMIEGEIKTVSTSGFSSEIPKLTIQGFHKGHNHLTEESSSNEPIKLEKNDTYSTIARKIAKLSDLDDKEIEDTDSYRPVITKKPIVYNDFFRDASKRVGFEFFIARKTFYFFNPRQERKNSLNMTFEWGEDLINFNPTVNTANLATEVEVRGHPSNAKTNLIGVATAGKEDKIEETENIMTASQLAVEIYGKKKVDIKNRIVASKKEADDMAKAELNLIGDNLITGSGSIIGTPELIPGSILTLQRVGKRFSGKYFVTKVSHTIDGNGYITSFNLRRNVIGKIKQ